VIVDDIVDTAGTLCAAASAVRQAGALRVLACITHPVLSGPAPERIRDSALDEVVVTDTIPSHERAIRKMHVLSVAPLLGEAGRRTNEEARISALFVGREAVRWRRSKSRSTVAGGRARDRRAGSAVRGSSLR